MWGIVVCTQSTKYRPPLLAREGRERHETSSSSLLLSSLELSDVKVYEREGRQHGEKSSSLLLSRLKLSDTKVNEP